MKAKYLLVLSLFIELASCSENKGTKSNSGEVDLESAIENAESRRKADPDASGGNKCLLDYQAKYDQLLSEADVLIATGFSKDAMETKNNKTLKNPEYHEFIYKFKNGRVSKTGITKGLPMPDVVKIGNIKAISLSAFESTYRAISDEEMKVAKDALNNAADGKSGDAEADAVVKKAEDQNVSKEQVKEIGSGIMDVMKEVSKGYTNVEGLGDAAVWNTVTSELFVLQNGVKFEIRTDISNDTEKNKSVAIGLAKTILDKCK